MWSSQNILERAPMVWVLLGLLFNAAGLYMGFQFGMSFVYMMIGWFCCAYGAALFLFRLRESPKQSTEHRLSPNFVSANATHEEPPKAADAPVSEEAGSVDTQPATE